MYNFFSAIGQPSGKILWNANVDSHSDLIALFGLDDTRDDARFSKLELTPHPNEWSNVDAWLFRFDEDTRPSWVTDELLAEWASRMRSIVIPHIVTTGTIKIIADGFWLLGGDVKVLKIIGGRVMQARGSASIYNVRGSTSIRNVRDSVLISDVGGSASIRNVWGSASIRDVWDVASISDVGGSASIRDVWDSVFMDDSAKNHVIDGVTNTEERVRPAK